MYSVSKNLELLSLNFDVEFCGFLVSLYQYGYNFVLTQCHESDHITLSHGFSLIYEISSQEQNSSYSALSGKVTSILVVVGLGSLLCYKLLKLANFNCFSPSKSSTTDSSSSPPGSATCDHLSIKTCYFGPKSANPYISGGQNTTGEKNDTSSGDPDLSSPVTYRAKSRRHSKHQRKGWLFSKVQRYILANRLTSKGRQEDLNESTDSSQSPAVLSVRREGSIDSVSSDLSLDLSIIVDPETSTVARMDQLLQEIESLKSNCLSMDEEFEIIKTNRNMPGLGSLMDSCKEMDNTKVTESAKACFKGLYSLTTINRSMSFDYSGGGSTDEESPVHMTFASIPIQTEEESFSSLEWDSQEASPFEPLDRMDISGAFSSVLTPMTSGETLLPMEDSWTPDSFDQLIESVDYPEQYKNGYRFEGDTTLPTGNLGLSTVDNNINLNKIGWNIIGPLIVIDDYIKTTKAVSGKTQQGFEAIRSILGNGHIRLISSDNNSAIRATLYQALCSKFPIPNGQDTINHLVEALRLDAHWLSDWNFAEQLPYNQNNFVQGMQICLTTLDNVASVIEGSMNRTEKLTNLMNTNPNLDVHIMEAVKFHMVAYALKKQEKDGQNNHCRAMVDFMNNLEPIGAKGFDKVEMTWLGSTLGVTLEVFSPSEFGTHKFRSYHPDSHISNWPTIILISEDSRNYNVFVD